MKRQLRCALLALAVTALLAIPALAAGDQHTGEVLGVHPSERTLTLRVTTDDSKEVVVFLVTDETVIRHDGSGEKMRLEDLRPGMKAVVASTRGKGGRRAVEISVRGDAPRRSKD